MAISPFIQRYAHERCSNISLEKELDQTTLDLEMLLNVNTNLQKENDSLQKIIQQNEGIQTINRNKELEEQNQELLNRVLTLTTELAELKKIMGKQDSMMDGWQLEKEELEIEKVTLKNQMEELSLRCKEDQIRLDLLHDECKSLSTKLDESMQVMSKYSTAYTNMKKRMNNNERTKVIVNEINTLSSSSLSHHLVMGQSDGLSNSQELDQMKNDIMDHDAYNIMVLQLSGAIITDTIVDTLFQIIADGVLPRLRVIDIYSIVYIWK